LTTKEVAEKLGISPTTVRKWADVFGEFLSTDATPGYRGVRDFTDDDLRLLSAVAFYRKQQRLSFEEILEKLRRGEYPTEPRSEVQPPAAEQPRPTPPAQNLERVRDELHKLTDAHQTLQASLAPRLDALAQRLEALESLPERVEDLTQRLDEAHGALATQEQIEQLAMELHRRLEELQTLPERLDALREVLVTREQVEQLGAELQRHQETLQTLQERLDGIDETLVTREQVEQLGERLQQSLEVLQALPERVEGLTQRLAVLDDSLKRLDEVHGALATQEQIEQLGTGLHRRLEGLHALSECLDELREASVTRGLVEQLVEEVRQQADQIRTLQELPDRVGALRAEIAEFRREFGEHAEQRRTRRGVAAVVAHAVQVLSWAILLVAALGALYYLDLHIWLTVLLAVLITGGVWLATRVVT
jgi:DNA repair exonuclease SbcCD ATPase subunit